MKRLEKRWLVMLAAAGCLISAPGFAEEQGFRPAEKISVDLKLSTSGMTGGGDVTGEETVYAKRDAVELRSGPRRGDEVVMTLEQGAALTIIGSRGAQLNVRAGQQGVEGWVSRLNTTPDKPRSGLGGVRILKSDDLGPRERSNVSAIRGLQEMAVDYAGAEDVPKEAVDDVKRMEAIALTIDEKDLDKFLAEGGVQ